MENEISEMEEIGNLYPREYVDDMADAAFAVVLNWLKKSGAPKEIIDTLDNGAYLVTKTRTDENGNDYSTEDKTDIPQSVAQITAMIYKTGYRIDADQAIYSIPVEEMNSVEA